MTPAPPNLSEEPSVFKFTPTVEVPSIGETQQNSADAEIESRAVTKTAASGIGVSDAGTFIAGAELKAPVLSGGTGGRAEGPKQTTSSIHVHVYGPVGEFHAMSKTENTTGASSHHVLSAGSLEGVSATAATISPSTGSSKMLQAGAAVITPTAISASALATNIPLITEPLDLSDDLHEIPASPASSVGLSTDESGDEASQIALPSTIKGYAAWIMDMGKRAVRSYDNILILIARHSSSNKSTMQRQRKICAQRQLFTERNNLLHQSICKISDGNWESEEVLDSAYPQVYSALELLLDQLNNARKYSTNWVEGGGMTCGSFATDFVDWFESLKTRYQEYAEAASVLTYAIDDFHGQQVSQSRFTEVLKKLTTEAHASWRLKQCLCRACPGNCHDGHTAYLSLDPDAPVGQMNGDSSRPVTEESYKAVWHMAFKSTIGDTHSLIWLKVESTVASVVPFSRMSNQIQPKDSMRDYGVLDSSTSGEDEPDCVLGPKSRKRRASSIPLQRPAKMQKTRPDQPRRMTDPGPQASSGIEFCPEYLMQHVATRKAIMRMTDSSGSDHHVFYLPQEQRDAYGVRAKDLTIRQILRRRRHDAYAPSWDLWWITRVARLVAEAVLRFDMCDSDPPPEDRIFFYGSMKYSDSFLWPFLEVKINKSGLSAFNPDTDTEARRSPSTQPERHRVLLHLGVILLKLGIKRGFALEDTPPGPKEIHKFISRHAEKTRVGPKYSAAIQGCAWFFRNKKALEELEFWDNFVVKVLQPLKQCEKIIQEQQANGNRLSKGPTGIGRGYFGRNRPLETPVADLG